MRQLMCQSILVALALTLFAGPASAAEPPSGTREDSSIPESARLKGHQSLDPILNGLKQNGIQINGFVVNGFVVNGLKANTQALNGMKNNGLYTNQLEPNTSVQNGMKQNSALANGMSSNGPDTNAIGPSGRLVNGAQREQSQPVGDGLQLAGVKLVKGVLVSR